MDSYLIMLLNNTFDKKEFACGYSELDSYLKHYANQDKKSHASQVYIAYLPPNNKVLGYYTISAYSFLPEDLPERFRKKLPRYPRLPGVLIGRLAVDKLHQGKKVGTVLLTNALLQSFNASKSLGIIGAIVEAKDQKASQFYKRFGFIEFAENNEKLFLPIKTIKTLFAPH